MLDSEKGQTRVETHDTNALAFHYHDYGYITLAPCTPFVRSVLAKTSANSNIVTSAGLFRPWIVGQYVFIGGWKRIVQVNSNDSIVISQMASSTGNVDTPIVTMNELTIEGAGMLLTRFDVEILARTR